MLRAQTRESCSLGVPKIANIPCSSAKSANHRLFDSGPIVTSLRHERWLLQTLNQGLLIRRHSCARKPNPHHRLSVFHRPQAPPLLPLWSAILDATSAFHYLGNAQNPPPKTRGQSRVQGIYAFATRATAKCGPRLDLATSCSAALADMP